MYFVDKIQVVMVYTSYRLFYLYNGKMQYWRNNMSKEGISIESHKIMEAGRVALDWGKLHEWARAQPIGAFLGQSCTNTLDPLGAYLGAATDTPSYSWSIGPSIKNGYGDRISKPDWVKVLVEETDQSTGHQSGPITREMYLEILERVNSRRK